MLEKEPTPFNNDGYAEPEDQPTSMQNLSREVWEANPNFRRYSPQRQEAALQSLNAVGIIAVSKCDGQWNSRRWADVWDELSVEEFLLVQTAVLNTSQAAMTTAFKNLFQMLEVGVTTMEQLREKKRVNKGRQVMVNGKVSHTRQVPMGPASVQNR